MDVLPLPLPLPLPAGTPPRGPINMFFRNGACLEIPARVHLAFAAAMRAQRVGRRGVDGCSGCEVLGAGMALHETTPWFP